MEDEQYPNIEREVIEDPDLKTDEKIAKAE